MNNVSRPSLQQRILQQYQKGAAPRSDGKTAASLNGHAAKPVGTEDHAEISGDALKLDSLRATLAAAERAAADVPDVRADKVADARARLATGQYDTAAVREELAGRLGSVLRRLEDLIG
jgi:hypothetical protein